MAKIPRMTIPKAINEEFLPSKTMAQLNAIKVKILSSTYKNLLILSFL